MSVQDSTQHEKITEDIEAPLSVHDHEAIRARLEEMMRPDILQFGLMRFNEDVWDYVPAYTTYPYMLLYIGHILAERLSDKIKADFATSLVRKSGTRLSASFADYAIGKLQPKFSNQQIANTMIPGMFVPPAHEYAQKRSLSRLAQIIHLGMTSRGISRYEL